MRDASYLAIHQALRFLKQMEFLKPSMSSSVTRSSRDEIGLPLGVNERENWIIIRFIECQLRPKIDLLRLCEPGSVFALRGESIAALHVVPFSNSVDPLGAGTRQAARFCRSTARIN